MFRKVGNPKSALRNNCVGLRHGREYGPYSSQRAVSLVRCEVPKNLQNDTLRTSKTVGNYGALSSIRTVVTSVFLYLCFSGTPKRERVTGRLHQYGPQSSPFSFALNSKLGVKTLQNFILWTHHHGEGNRPSSSERSMVPSVLPCLKPQG